MRATEAVLPFAAQNFRVGSDSFKHGDAEVAGGSKQEEREEENRGQGLGVERALVGD